MTTFFLVLIYLKIAQSSVVVPTDRVVVAGQRMEMECRSGSGTKVREWTLQRPWTMETLKVFSNFDREPNRIDPKFEHFGADVDVNGSGIIYSNSTRLTDAGVYTCRVQEGQKQPVPYSAQLVVLEKEPVCATNLTSGLNLKGKDKIWFQCSVNFSGNWAPNIEWRQHCGDSTKHGQLLNDEVETIIAYYSSVTSTLILYMDSSRSSCNISCKIDFSIKNSNTVNTTAPNTTDFSYVWRSYEIQVSTGFRLSTWDSKLMSDVSMSHLERGDTTVLATVHSIPAPGELSVTVGISLAVAVVLFVVMILLCHKYRRRRRILVEAVDLQKLGNNSQDKGTAMEIRPSNAMLQSDNTEAPHQDGERLAAILVYLMTAMLTWVGLFSTIRKNFTGPIIKDEESAKGSYATLAQDTATHRAEVSIHEYDDVALSSCDDVAIYSDVRSNLSQIERHLWTPHYCGFVSAEETLPTLSTRMEDCREATGSTRQLSRQSPIPEVSRHLKQGVDSTSRRDVCIDNTLRTIFCNELQDDVIRDAYPEETDYLHFDNKTLQTKLSKAGRCDAIGEVSPFEMDSCYLTMTDFMDSSYLRTTECLDSSYVTTTTDCTDLNASWLKENPKPAFKGCVTHPVTPKAHTESDSNRQLVLK